MMALPQTPMMALLAQEQFLAAYRNGEVGRLYSPLLYPTSPRPPTDPQSFAWFFE